jgi:YbgC/YbaW family acyl-CoA thioester hydrolase
MTPARVSEFRLRRRVNFYDVDHARVVHFSNYYRYMEEAEYGLWRAAGINLAIGDFGFPRVAASFDFHAPLRFDDEFEVHLAIAAIGRSSIRYACRISRGDTRVATGSMTVVCVSPESMRPAPLPPDRRDRIEVASQTPAD